MIIDTNSDLTMHNFFCGAKIKNFTVQTSNKQKVVLVRNHQNTLELLMYDKLLSYVHKKNEPILEISSQ